MSLINDALKRANQTRKQQAAPPQSGPPLQPVPSATPPASAAPMVLFFGLILLLIGVGGWFLARGFKAGKPAPAGETGVTAPVQTADSNPAPPPVPAPAPESALVSAPASPPAPASVRRVVNTSVVVSMPAPAAVAKPSVAAPVPSGTTLPQPPPAALAVARPVSSGRSPDAPPLKLQGVYFRRTNPSALINGKNVYAGDRVDGARVVGIERQSVVVEVAGKQQVLHLP